MPFEDLLAEPNEQYDARSELLASIVDYAGAPSATAGLKPQHPATEPQTPDPVTPTIHNVLYGALSAALLDHDIHLAPEVRWAIRDDIEAAIAPLIAGKDQP